MIEGAQHNTYDVEFYGPNPLCGIYYLGALRAVEEMARAVGDDATRHGYRAALRSGPRVDRRATCSTASTTCSRCSGCRSDRDRGRSCSARWAPIDAEQPEYQLGEGCLVDQLVGQYLADVAGLGPLVDPEHCRKTLETIYRYNYKRELFEHANVAAHVTR